MNFDAETYETIENYLTGKLQGTPRSDFEQRLQTDKGLAEEVAIHEKLYEQMAIKTVLASAEANAFQDKLNNALTQHKQKNAQTTIRKLNWKPLAIAASISLLIGFFFLQNGSTDSLTLYNDYAKHETLALVSKGAENYDFSEITAAYQKDQYELTDEKIRMALQELPQNHPHLFSLKLTQGICRLELDKVDEAKRIFQRLSQTDHLDAPKADWYLVLTYLKQGNTELAKQVIDKAFAAGHGYKAKEMREIKAAL